MKIKIKAKKYEDVIALSPEKHKKPKRPNVFWRSLLRVIAGVALKKAHFKYEKLGMERLGKKEPCLVLMNHSSFIDLEIVARLMYPRPFNIVATTDCFVGLGWLLRQIGCIPAKKFVFDISLIRDITYASKKLKSNIIMFPEASYSFDGTATPLPDTLGKFVKMLGIPVVMVRTYGAFLREPLYNNIQKRDVDVRAEMKYLLSSEQINALDAEEINQILKKEFSFDYFREQKDQKIKISEPFRADSLDRVLYKCPHCMEEGKMEGKGIHLVCHSCGKQYELDEYGSLICINGEGKFDHIPDWYAWERECVRREIESGEYLFDADVKIFMAIDTHAIYDIGHGHLTHTAEGFTLTGADGKLEYTQKPQATYSLYSDFYWYEIGDVVCIGNTKALYYCFPEGKTDFAAKLRMAAEEMYKLFEKEKSAKT